jgi:hypothetical protein
MVRRLAHAGDLFIQSLIKVYPKRFVFTLYKTTFMRVLSSWRFAGSASLVITALLLCLGAFRLSHSTSGAEGSAVLTMVGAPHAEYVANGLPIEGRYPAMFADEEDEGRDELPKNAMLLRTLVLALFYGPVLGWLLASGWRGSRPEVTSLSRCCFHSMVRLRHRRAVATLLGVFRL